MRAESLYQRLPVRAQHWAVSAAGWNVKRTRFGKSFANHLKRYRAQSCLSAEEIAALRDARVRQFIEHAVQHVPYYRKLFRGMGLEAGDIRGADDLKLLPILRKRTVQDHHNEFVSHQLPNTRRIHVHTSGSTGAGLRFISTLDAHQEQWAVWWRYREWHGLSREKWCLYFGGRSVVPLAQHEPPFWRYNAAGKQVLFSAYHLGQSTADAYLGEVQKYPDSWIHGYPSVVSLLASYILRTGIRPAVRWVTLGAESLLPHQDALIREAFGVAPIQHYGMAEAVANASLCPEGRLHVDEDFAAVNFRSIDDQNNAIIGTNFTNLAFPLINYDTGDIAALSGGTCVCGRPGRVIERIDGRREDYVVTKSGALLGRLDHIFKDQVNVREAQIVQTSRGRMVLKIVRGPNFSAGDESCIRAETTSRVGREVDFEVEYVDAIPRTKSGKLRFVISDVLPSDKLEIRSEAAGFVERLLR